jgi:antirestriction protein ArdC
VGSNNSEGSRLSYPEKVTQRIIECLQAGTAPWIRPWEAGNIPDRPYNPVSQAVYRGLNTIYLSIAALMKGYDDPRWMTFLQCNSKSWNVRRGEHAETICYFSRTTTRAEEDPDTHEKVKRTYQLERPIFRYACVFNACQIEGIGPLDRKIFERRFDPLQKAEEIIHSHNPVIIYDQGNACFYRPSTDSIHLTPVAQFRSQDLYYSTVLHEMGHWTGHSTRLDRNISNLYGTPAYAREELRAEIASYMLSSDIGISYDPTNHASYIASWIEVLDQDKTEIFKASNDAERILHFIVGQGRSIDRAFEDAIESPVRFANDRSHALEVDA